MPVIQTQLSSSVQIMIDQQPITKIWNSQRNCSVLSHKMLQRFDFCSSVYQYFDSPNFPDIWSRLFNLDQVPAALSGEEMHESVAMGQLEFNVGTVFGTQARKDNSADVTVQHFLTDSDARA